MDWTEQTNAFMQSLAEAQKQMWSGWMNFLPTATPFGTGASLFDPSQLMKMSVDAWSGLREGTTQRVAGNLFGTPDIMMRSIQLLMKAWQVAGPQIEQGKPWQPDLQKLLGQWQQELLSFPSRQSEAASQFADLTRSVFERWSPMTGPWLAMVGQAMAGGHPAAAFLSGTQGLNQLMGFEEGVFPVLAGVSQLPRGTVMREKMGKFLAVMDATTDLRAAQAEYNKAIGEAMGKAVEETISHLSELAAKGEKISSVRELMRVWFGIADKTLNHVFTTEEFLAIQDKMISAVLNHKVKMREALEIIYDSMEIPTRGALDEAYKDIQDLKRQVRMLKRQLQEITQTPARGAGRKASAKAAATPATTEAPAV